MMSHSILVSVITPAFNARDSIESLVEALRQQTYDKDNIEIIIVDNGSTDDTLRFCQSLTDIKFILQTEKQSPDASRNKAISIAKGDVIAFTDADCFPDKDWLKEGTEFLQRTSSDLVGGKIHIFIDETSSLWERLDSISFLQHQKSIPERQVAFTANLFVRSTVFHTIGMFPEDVYSSGDAVFCSLASRAGLNIAYCERAVVYHSARSCVPFLRKCFRVGVGKYLTKKQGYPLNGLRDKTAILSHPLIQNLNPSSLRSQIGLPAFTACVLSAISVVSLSILLLGYLSAWIRPAAFLNRKTKISN